MSWQEFKSSGLENQFNPRAALGTKTSRILREWEAKSVLARKDLDLIQDLIKEHGTRSELTQACHNRFQEAKDRYGKEAGEMTVCKLIEEDANTDLRVKGDWTAPWEVKHSSEKT